MAGPHQGRQVLLAGTPLEEAQAAAIMLHGRGAGPYDILSLSAEFDPGGMAFLAPEAADWSWWPARFIDPIEHNEPYFSSALEVVGALLDHLQGAGIPPEKTILLGFSQGACLALEFAVRNAQHYGGVFGLSGGLFGPPGTAWDYPGSLEGTPVFLGCSDIDPHIPKERVEESEQVFKRMGAEVTMRLYPGMGHTINMDETSTVRRIVAALRGDGAIDEEESA